VEVVLQERVIPKLSEFFGIAIYMYWGDHGPPHFHARYGGEKASISIEDLSTLAGGLPPRALGLAMNGRRFIGLSWRMRGEGQQP
jgi:hypothetical protein